MGIGPVPATRKLLARAGLKLGDIDVFELNEAFAAQALAVRARARPADDAAHVNPNGGAIALGHPLGASGARLATTALRQLERSGGRYGVATHVHRRRPGNRHAHRARVTAELVAGDSARPDRGRARDVYAAMLPTPQYDWPQLSATRGTRRLGQA